MMKPNKRVKASGELARRLCHEYRKEGDAYSSSNIPLIVGYFPRFFMQKITCGGLKLKFMNNYSYINYKLI
ncbi:hypothetical protein D3C74_216560 [compost metagenome]